VRRAGLCHGLEQHRRGRPARGGTIQKVGKWRQRFVEGGLEAFDVPQPGSVADRCKYLLRIDLTFYVLRTTYYVLRTFGATPFWVQALLRVEVAVVRTVIAGPATFEPAGPMVSRTIIADRPGVGEAWMVRSGVVRLSVVGWTEIVEQKRERERDPETNSLGPGGD